MLTKSWQEQLFLEAVVVFDVASGLLADRGELKHCHDTQ